MISYFTDLSLLKSLLSRGYMSVILPFKLVSQNGHLTKPFHPPHKLQSLLNNQLKKLVPKNKVLKIIDYTLYGTILFQPVDL